MSRAFVKDDADHEQVVVPHRAPLPAGMPNLVTPAGLAELKREHAQLLSERSALQSARANAPETLRRLTALVEELDALEERLASAEVVPTPPAGTREVRLGATVTVRDLGPAGRGAPPGGGLERFTIVGVDQADPLEGRVAFPAPAAQALLGRSVGDEVRVEAGDTVRHLRIEAVAYQQAGEGSSAAYGSRDEPDA